MSCKSKKTWGPHVLVCCWCKFLSMHLSRQGDLFNLNTAVSGFSRRGLLDKKCSLYFEEEIVLTAPSLTKHFKILHVPGLSHLLCPLHVIAIPSLLCVSPLGTLSVAKKLRLPQWPLIPLQRQAAYIRTIAMYL